MSWHPRQLPEQTGRTVVGTGANSGIGFEAARALVGRGAHVVLAVRDPAKGQCAAKRMAGTGRTTVVELDLSDLDQLSDCATTLLDRLDDVSAVICKAGVMGRPLRLTAQGFERQTATNHVGHAALVARCGRCLISAPRASSWCRAPKRAAGSCRARRRGSSS